MDLEELAKKVEWLEKERRKDVATISDLQEKLNAYDGNFALIQSRLKDVDDNLSRFASTAGRLDQFDGMVAQYRSEVTKAIEGLEKRRQKHEREIEDRRRGELDGFNKSLLDLRGSVESLQEVRKSIRARVDEDARLAHNIAQLEKKLNDFDQFGDDLRRSVRLTDEARKQDSKRIADLQGELSANRKRSEEAREKVDVNADVLRQIDGRVNELMASEADRRQAQVAFIEQQNLFQVERNRSWKEIQTKFEAFSKQTAVLDQQLTAIEETHRSVKRSQEAFDDINQRLERRINEITEIQRLAEDRFRQEWVTFKSDDQKRWTNYTLTQDEIVKDVRSELEKLNQRLADIDETIQTLQDMFEQAGEATETQLQELMNWAHEYLTHYERIMGRSRPVR